MNEEEWVYGDDNLYDEDGELKELDFEHINSYIQENEDEI